MLDVAAVKAQFPLLKRQINGQPIVYLDSANSTQKPQCVLDAMSHFMATSYAPVNRSAYHLAAEANDAYEGARAKTARLINAAHDHEIIFTKNATEALNVVIQSWGRANLKQGDVVVLTHMEHHANIVPWHMLVAELGIQLRWVGLTEDGLLDLSNLTELLDGAKVFSFTAMSNVLGTINPVRQLTDAAHAAGALAFVDACQSVPHMPTDVHQLGADFAFFSSHKLCGPTGIGILWGREALLDAMPPFLGGGNMIADVRLDGFTTAPLPAKFEAGTPPIIEAVGLGAAIDFLTGLGLANIRRHEIDLTTTMLNRLTSHFGDDISIYGPTNTEIRGGVVSFAMKDVHPHDISQVLDETNVCIRAGHHCAKPLMKVLGVGSTARASVYLYNDESDVEALVLGLDAARNLFAL